MLKQVVNPTYAPITHPATPFGTFEAYAHLSFPNTLCEAAEPSLSLPISFYPFYLGEHSNRVNRIFHLVGTSVALTCHARVVAALVSYLLRRQTSVQVGPEVGKVLNRLALSAGEAGKVFLTGIIGAYTCAWIGCVFCLIRDPRVISETLMICNLYQTLFRGKESSGDIQGKYWVFAVW